MNKLKQEILEDFFETFPQYAEMTEIFDNSQS